MTFEQLAMLLGLGCIAISFAVGFWALWAALPLYREARRLLKSLPSQPTISKKGLTKMTTTTRNIIVTLIAISVAAVFFAIWRSPLDSIIAGSAIFAADAFLRLTKPNKPGIVDKSKLIPPQR